MSIFNKLTSKRRLRHINIDNCVKILIIKPTRCTNFSNLFLEQKSTCFGQVFCPSSGVQYCIHCLLAGSGCSILIPLESNQHKLYDIYLLVCVCVQYQTPDDGQKTCPKNIEFYSKNKFEKLVQLVGFIIRINPDPQSSECQLCENCLQTRTPYCINP